MNLPAFAAPRPREDALLALAPREAAVIDVGSNSVRLVVYRVEGPCLTQVLNEKTLAGLGRDLSRAGRLEPAACEQALAALARFARLLEGLGRPPVLAVATAAVRDAADGPDFVARVKAETGVELRVLSGEEEARTSALGVLAGAPGARGVVGDLGGSSLELVRLSAEGLEAGETHRLGPLSAGRLEPFDLAHAEALIGEALDRSAVLAAAPGEAFYAVGGAWRALGRIEMELRGYPLQVLHNYAIPRADVLDLCAFVARQSRRSLEKLDGAAGKRAETLPYAATLLSALMQRGRFQSLVISSYGLREGLLWETIPAADKALDPLVAGAAVIAARDQRARAFGQALAAWIAPVFAGLPDLFAPGRAAVLRQAACQLADIGALLHPDHRGELAFNLVLRAPVAGADHVERTFLATAAFHRYSFRGAPPGWEGVQRLLDDDRAARARALGAAMRLGADLSGRSAALLADCRLAVAAGRLTLTAGAGARSLITEAVEKRLVQLGETLGLAVAVD